LRIAPRLGSITLHAANHYRDCERYQRALAFILNVELLTEAAPAAGDEGRMEAPVLTMPDGRPFLLTER